MNTETHDVERTLPTSVSRTDTGFQVTPAAKALYFDYFDGHQFQIVAVPLDGGPPRRLADGDTFALSADGKLLAVTGEADAHGGTPPAHPSVRIVRARTGSAVASIRMSVHGVLRSMAWVAGEPALLVVVQEGMGCVLGGISAPCDGPGPISVAYLLDVEGSRMHASKVPASRSLPVGLAGWTTVRLSAPGPTAGTVLATSRTGALKILVVRASDGQVLHQYLPPSPPGDLSVNVRGVDASGRHFLLAATQARTTRLWQWTPPSPRLTLVGPADVEASW